MVSTYADEEARRKYIAEENYRRLGARLTSSLCHRKCCPASAPRDTSGLTLLNSFMPFAHYSGNRHALADSSE